ncbi:hypothetical protein CFC21_062615, partial [Triticum aestivum]
MRLSFRQDLSVTIFMTKSETREHCFGSGGFRLPLKYQVFVDNVKQRMPLFLLTIRAQTLPVFEATSDGWLNITKSVAFILVWRSCPAQ